jgi:ClpP class serine protease
MARRASSRPNPGIIIGAAAAIAVAVFAGKSLLGKKTASFGDVAKLHIEDLLENGNSLRGNEYVIEGQIDEKLQWTSDRGQLVSLRVNTPGGDEFIGIEIPAEFNKLNIDTRQKYAFRVKFRQGGIAVATGVNRL